MESLSNEYFHLEELPQELQVYFLGYLDSKELSAISLTSWYWFHLALSSWKKLCEIKWDKESIEPSEDPQLQNWRLIYRQHKEELPQLIFEEQRLDEGLLTIQNGTRVEFKGKVGGNQAVKADRPFVKRDTTDGAFHIALEAFYSEDRKILYRFVRRSNIHYYEITISPSSIEKKFQRTPCVAVGLAQRQFPFVGLMPGWRTGSYGYHSDDGRRFAATESWRYGKSFGKGDTVGCAWESGTGRIFYTLNGSPLDYAFNGVAENELWAVIGVDTNDIVTANFGEEPFAYDFKKPPDHESCPPLPLSRPQLTLSILHTLFGIEPLTDDEFDELEDISDEGEEDIEDDPNYSSEDDHQEA